MQSGSELTLSLFMPDHHWPMKVDRAIVRWTRGRVFGVKFLNMQPSHRERLRLFIISLQGKH
ncbi:MAG: hypothetical protein C4293_07700 [Nitrospiraceae bacterium]